MTASAIIRRNPIYPEVFLTDDQRVSTPQLPHIISPDKQGRAGAFNAHALSGIADIFRVIKKHHVPPHRTAHRMEWWLTFPCTRVSFHQRGQWQHRTGYRNQPQRLPLLHSGQATFCHFGCHTGRDTKRRSRQHKCHRFIPRGVKRISMQRHQCHDRDQFSRILNHGIRLR